MSATILPALPNSKVGANLDKHAAVERYRTTDDSAFVTVLSEEHSDWNSLVAKEVANEMPKTLEMSSAADASTGPTREAEVPNENALLGIQHSTLITAATRSIAATRVQAAEAEHSLELTAMATVHGTAQVDGLSRIYRGSGECGASKLPDHESSRATEYRQVAEAMNPPMMGASKATSIPLSRDDQRIKHAHTGIVSIETDDPSDVIRRNVIPQDLSKGNDALASTTEPNWPKLNISNVTQSPAGQFPAMKVGSFRHPSFLPTLQSELLARNQVPSEGRLQADLAKPEGNNETADACSNANSAITPIVPKEPHDLPPGLVQLAAEISTVWLTRNGSTLPGAPEVAASATLQPPTVITDVAKSVRFDLDQGEHGGVRVRLFLNGEAMKIHLSFSGESSADAARTQQHTLVQALSDVGVIVSSFVIDAGGSQRTDGNVLNSGLDTEVSSNSGTSTNQREREPSDSPSDEQNARRHVAISGSLEATGMRTAARSGLFI